MIKSLKSVLNRILQPHGNIHNFIKDSASQIGLTRRRVYSDKSYHQWVVDNELEVSTTLTLEDDKVYVSIVICCWNTPTRYLRSLEHSLLQQRLMKGWEVIIVDVSSESDRTDVIEELCKRYKNFTYVKAENQDISSNTNVGITHAKGEYIAFVDHDDTLSTEAINEVVAIILKNKPDIIYSDEDKITDKSSIRHSPYFKPDWSPHLFFFTNFTNHLSVIKKSLIDAVGGLDPQYNGAQDYELLLRIHSSSKIPIRVHHIPKILYHWREAPQSTASNHNNKLYAFDAGRRALEAFFERKGVNVAVTHIENSPGFYKQIFIPPSDVTVVINVTVDCNTSQYAAYITKLERMTSTKLKVEYIKNETSAGYDIQIDINKFCYPTSPTWIDELIGVACLNDVMSVSPRILSEHARLVDDVGTVSCNNLSAFSGYKGLMPDEYTPTGGAWWVRNMAITPSSAVIVRQVKKHTSQKNQYHTIWSHVDFKLNY